MPIFRPRSPIWSGQPVEAAQAPEPPPSAVISTVAAVAFGLGMGSAFAASARPPATPPAPAVTRPAVVQSEPPRPYEGAVLREIGGPAQASSIVDTFTDTSGTVLSSHTPDAGGTWTQHGSYSGDQAAISNANRARPGATIGGSGIACYYWSGTPASADYTVSADATIQNAAGFAAVCGRLNTAADTFYFLKYDPTVPVLQLGKRVAGSETILASVNPGWSVGSTHNIALSLSGSVLSAWADSVQILGPVSDSSISAAGKIAVLFSQTGVPSPDTKFVHLDNLTLSGALSAVVMRPAAGTVASSEPPRPFPGWVYSVSSEGPQAATVAPARPTIVSADAPRPHDGLARETSAMPPAIPRTTVPAVVEVISSEAPRPYPGWAFWDANTTPPPLFGAPPQPVLARAEEPRPEPGRAIDFAGMPPQPALAHGAAVVLAWQEPPRPYEGRIVSAIGPAPDPPQAPPVPGHPASSEPPRPHGGAVLLSTVRYTVTPNPATPRRSFVVAAEPPRPEDGRVLGAPDTLRKRPPRDTLSGIIYRIYVNDAKGGPVNYTTPIGSTPGLTWTSDPLAAPAVYKFGVRAYDNATSLEEKNVDCVVTVRIDAGTVDITAIPDPPTALSAVAKSGGGVRIDWAYQTNDTTKTPTGFRVYYGGAAIPGMRRPWGATAEIVESRGMSARGYLARDVSVQQPIAARGGMGLNPTVRATVPYTRGVVFYTTTLSGLSDGQTYRFVVRAYNATGEEQNGVEAVIVADASAPPAPYSLSGTSTS